ncbi:hypothetical protein GCM10022292_17540 [Winogradskyella damuponensis]|uniref:Uncharacterized protein n=1 Tax=Winogradskyella damuponensis TaxID=943939 RepID=A0ABP8CTX7_9FLAO
MRAAKCIISLVLLITYDSFLIFEALIVMSLSLAVAIAKSFCAEIRLVKPKIHKPRRNFFMSDTILWVILIINDVL